MVGPKQTETQSWRVPAVSLLRGGRRWITFGLVAATLAVFASINAFWQFLSTGQWINYSPEAFRRDLAVPLGQMLLSPLSIFNYPWMTLVTGFILAVVIFVPILVAVLHRLWLAMVFVVIVAVLGHAPVLAGALVIGCVLTSRTPLRSDTPFLAVLLGLVPVAVYLYLFGLSLVSEAAVLPLQRGVAGAPFLIALLSASLVCGFALSVARVSGYRQWVIWPVIMILMSGPMTVFYFGVGTDELEYSLITSRLAPGDSIYKTQSLANMRRDEDSGGLTGEGLFNAVTGSLKTRRVKLIGACREFVARYPDSQRAPAVLWVAAQCHSLRISRPALRDGRVMYYASHLSNASRGTWEKLVNEYRKSRQAALAHWRLGQLALREAGRKVLSDEVISEHLVQADKHLAWAEKRLATIVAESDEADDRSIDRVFLPVPLLPTRGCYRQALVEVQRLRWLIVANSVVETWEKALADGKADARLKAKKLLTALSDYLQIDANGLPPADYRKSLATLIEKFEGTNLGDNLTLAWASAPADPDDAQYDPARVPYDRARALIPLAEVRPPTDAAIQASFELGILASGTAGAAALGLVENLRKPEEYFKLVIAAPDNPWKPLARERLAWLEAQQKETTP
ncbi:MAG: hypothetical protein QGG42_02830 [Phycisphaerae bacterium]|jgi:hypothetical protein|nr:hypothetical protein [Phycisphaerae bacterium]